MLPVCGTIPVQMGVKEELVLPSLVQPVVQHWFTTRYITIKAIRVSLAIRQDDSG